MTAQLFKSTSRWTKSTAGRFLIFAALRECIRETLTAPSDGGESGGDLYITHFAWRRHAIERWTNETGAINYSAGGLLSPRPPAAVAAGNVETSQNIVDAIFAALSVCAAAQGTCNNFTVGFPGKQYYETVCGGMGAGKNFSGANAVQVHMTNSRASDPEVLEWNYPLRLEEFSFRQGQRWQRQKSRWQRCYQTHPFFNRRRSKYFVITPQHRAGRH